MNFTFIHSRFQSRIGVFGPARKVLLAPLRRRMADLQIPAEDASRLIDEALQDPGWRSLATLDAATAHDRIAG